MGRKRVGRYSNEFRRMCVERLKQSNNIVELAKELNIHRRLLYRWRDELDPVEKSAWPPVQNSRESRLRKEVGQLKRVLADKTVELDFFQRCLAKSRGSTPAERRDWREGIYDQRFTPSELSYFLSVSICVHLWLILFRSDDWIPQGAQLLDLHLKNITRL